MQLCLLSVLPFKPIRILCLVVRVNTIPTLQEEEEVLRSTEYDILPHHGTRPVRCRQLSQQVRSL